MTDNDMYSKLFQDFVSRLDVSVEKRKEMIEQLPKEVVTGFEVVLQAGGEELSARLNGKMWYKDVQETVETLLLFSLWGGYLLHTLSIGMLAEDKSKLESLESQWMAAYEKDQCATLIAAINIVHAGFLDTIKQGRMNQLVTQQPLLLKQSYEDVATIDLFMLWAARQGYIISTMVHTI
ncbi:MAG: hypothetical protein WC775_05455 [Patescibacteria group bacterium]|jgi:hypothetical protein